MQKFMDFTLACVGYPLIVGEEDSSKIFWEGAVYLRLKSACPTLRVVSSVFVKAEPACKRAGSPELTRKMAASP